MARKAILAVSVLLLPLLSGCIAVEGSYSHESPSDCWAFCGGTTEYNTFLWFPMMMVLLLVIGIVVAVIAASGNPPPRQQIIIQQEEKD